ncbi:DUF4251 domain-containing protein [Maribacter algicola]|uniref:DUF4251 domain-containing protein n=1 Tax=Meishania litoralis TaxID=3434685 RepID=A0ACC7LKQ9_9FLAO
MNNLKILIFFALAFNLAHGQTKSEIKEAQYAKIKELIASGEFVFVADRAIPRGGSSISLVTNPNYLKVVKDSTTAYMPFFGERFAGGGFGEPGAITFETIIEDLVVHYNDKKDKITFKFSANNDYDRFGLVLEIGRSGWANLRIRSIDRSTIGYYGRVMKVENNPANP